MSSYFQYKKEVTTGAILRCENDDMIFFTERGQFVVIFLDGNPENLHESNLALYVDRSQKKVYQHDNLVLFCDG